MAEEQQSLPVMYTNSVRFFWSLHEFSLILGMIHPPLDPPKKGEDQSMMVQAYGKVVMSPTHFKRFVEVAGKMLKGYEDKYGKIPSEEKTKPKNK
jgi:hypothetical protein